MDATTDGPSPSPPDDSGREAATGRFAAGNTFGEGNPHHKRVAELRSALLDAISPEDVRAIVEQLVQKAKGGDLAAAREVLDRCLGKPNQAIALEGRGYFVPELTDEEMRRAREIAARADAVTPEELRAVAEGRTNPSIYSSPTNR